LLTACGDSEPPLSDATSLVCPTPGALPFRLESHAFQRADNKTLATNDPRNKDEASDTLGNPGGAIASTYIADNQSPATAPIEYRGAKARTGTTAGFFATPLPGEFASLWSYDPNQAAWENVGRAQTGDDGYYSVSDSGFVAPNDRPIYSVLEADGSCAEHYDYLLPAGTKVVVTDIDGTLTASDDELFKQISDEAYVPAMKTAADKLTQAWTAKGYTIIYLTARPHVFRPETRVWLRDLGFSSGPLITATAVGDAAAYKTIWLQRLITSFGWNAVVAYGNADTDIAAYANVGIPKDHTFIIGPLAGNDGTVAIPNDDYTQHIATFVNAQPSN
jgi:hypothetical protein